MDLQCSEGVEVGPGPSPAHKSREEGSSIEEWVAFTMYIFHMGIPCWSQLKWFIRDVLGHASDNVMGSAIVLNNNSV